MPSVYHCYMNKVFTGSAIMLATLLLMILASCAEEGSQINTASENTDEDLVGSEAPGTVPVNLMCHTPPDSSITRPNPVDASNGDIMSFRSPHGTAYLDVTDASAYLTSNGKHGYTSEVDRTQHIEYTVHSVGEDTVEIEYTFRFVGDCSAVGVVDVDTLNQRRFTSPTMRLSR